MPGYIQNPYVPQYGGFQVANPFASMYTGCCNNNVAI